MTIVQSIRESILNSGSGITTPFFDHGRSSDSTLTAAKEYIAGTFVYLDPIRSSGALEDSTETAVISMGFLTQDEPDSASDRELNEGSTLSMEEKVENMKAEARAWMNYYFDNYMYRISGNYNFEPIYRAKNVMTGVVLTFSLIEPKGC
jgi:hypothetical protein